MLYCDNCASIYGHVIINSEDKQKGVCAICHRYAGPCNFVEDEKLEFNNITSDPVELAGFQINEIKGFPIGQRIDMIDPGIPHKIVGNKKVVFYRKDSVVVGDMNTGKRVEIKF